jgi:hypothetical protein
VNRVDVGNNVRALNRHGDVLRPAARVTADRIIWLVDHAAAPTGTH